MNNWVIITSVNGAKPRYSEYLNLGWNIVVVGDLKSAEHFSKEFASLRESSEKRKTSAGGGVHYLTYSMQQELYPELSSLIGPNTYARKNLGYLYAIGLGAEHIFETDDDTFLRFPTEDPLQKISKMSKFSVTGSIDYFNPYSYFAPESGIWPRGYPLNLVKRDKRLLKATITPITRDLLVNEVDIVQTLVNLEPDVDAIYRLTENADPVDFEYQGDLLLLDQHIYSPGNTQSTFWITKKCQNFLYLPATVDFRFCDILKMYIAQSQNRFAYAGFFTEQFRNPHNLMSDFESEISSYLNVEKTVCALKELEFGTEIFDIYKELARINIVKPKELEILNLFLNSLYKKNLLAKDE
jgi:hypothetical protein